MKLSFPPFLIIFLSGWDDWRVYGTNGNMVNRGGRWNAQGFGDVLCQLKLTRIPRQDSQASLESCCLLLIYCQELANLLKKNNKSVMVGLFILYKNIINYKWEIDKIDNIKGGQ